MRPLALIPARGSSKRFPRKNLAQLRGRPLLAWTIEAALGSRVFDAVWVSSEDPEVLDVARRYGARQLDRPPHLADDRATIGQVCRHVLEQLALSGERFEAIYILTPTTPFRTARSIRAAWERFVSSDTDALLSVVPTEHTPQYCLVEDGGWLRPWIQSEYEVPRPDLIPTYRHDGGHQIVRTDAFLKDGRLICGRTLAHYVAAEEAVDINWPIDLEWAEFLLSRGRVPA